MFPFLNHSITQEFGPFASDLDGALQEGAKGPNSVVYFVSTVAIYSLRTFPPLTLSRMWSILKPAYPALRILLIASIIFGAASAGFKAPVSTWMP